jgi:hypothetical protein
MTNFYSEEDILPRFTYPKWILGTSWVVLSLFVYALVDLRGTHTQIVLKQNAITAFEAKNYNKCLQLLSQLPMNGSFAYYQAGSLYALQDTNQFPVATTILQSYASALTKEQVLALNEILHPQGYHLGALHTRSAHLIYFTKREQ